MRIGFPGGSDGKESACIAGDPGLIPGSGRSPGEGNGNPLEYSCLENPMDRGGWRAIVHGVSQSQNLENSSAPSSSTPVSWPRPLPPSLEEAGSLLTGLPASLQFNQYLLGTFHGPGPVLPIGATAVNKNWQKSLSVWSLHFILLLLLFFGACILMEGMVNNNVRL